MKANSYLSVDLAAVAENVSEIQKIIGKKCSLIPVLKGDAYGLGGVRFARFLSSRDGIDTKTIVLTVERNTKNLETVVRMQQDED